MRTKSYDVLVCVPYCVSTGHAIDILSGLRYEAVLLYGKGSLKSSRLQVSLLLKMIIFKTAMC